MADLKNSLNEWLYVLQGVGIQVGSGAPSSLTAKKGSLYINTAGSTTNDRIYINTDGATTWTYVTCGA